MKEVRMMSKSQENLEKVEQQIETRQKNVAYDTREFTIEIIVNKFLKEEDKDNNELYVPEYQREFVWDERRQSRFIESVILGLPIPLIFVAEISEDGRLEIVDGSQRIRTLAAFLYDQLRLDGLTTLSYLNDFVFSELSISRQRKVKNVPMRMIVLSSKATEEVRNDMFDRINTSSLPLTPMEKRKGIYRGKFNDLVFACAQNATFRKLCPIGTLFKDRQEEAELVLRLFGFSEAYPKFTELGKNGVAKYLDDYLAEKNESATAEDLEKKKQEFESVVTFVNKTFPYGFAKNKQTQQIARPYFEAIAIGTNLALKENSQLVVKNKDWAVLDKNNRNEFYEMLSARYHTHKPDKLRERIDFVKSKLLENNERIS